MTGNTSLVVHMRTEEIRPSLPSLVARFPPGRASGRAWKRRARVDLHSPYTSPAASKGQPLARCIEACWVRRPVPGEAAQFVVSADRMRRCSAQRQVHADYTADRNSPLDV